MTRVVGQMTPEEFTQARHALGLSQQLMANALTRHKRTIQRYQYPLGHKEHNRIPGIVANQVRHWLKVRGITLDLGGTV